jgi:hypothetical protein
MKYSRMVDLVEKEEMQVEIISGNYDWFRIDMDRHANTCCVVNGILILNKTERTE